jgi:hypothetical protein
MSTTGHYTRYINQENREQDTLYWSDNCDTMYAGVYLRTNNDPSKYMHEADKLGYFTIEHNHGNTLAWLSFTWDNAGYSWEKDNREHYGSNMRCGRIHYQFEGKKAIQSN